MIAQRLVPLGYQQIGTLTGATGLTVPSGATLAIISAEGTAVRWRDDGVAPTAAIGVPMAITDSPLQYSGTLAALKFIEQTASAKLNVAYYRVAG
ncbi:MAG: hypothetical protein JWR61_5829 [Ferruginibacter sp.]|uniref:hypothetical protein n=1 Tax=Ferruginibacter sp. TaxID=1940288 RepID=UPI002658A90C|nr:hypothetical protein [Ferruginibacter sp.]MDB5280874.1 hypothetical protein [Ferruginibacter sp.]